MLYAFPPKSREITDYKLENGILYLYSQALRHRIIPISEDIARISCTDTESFDSGEKPGVILKTVSDGWKLSADSETLTFSSAALSIVIDRKTASYSYLDGDGRILLREKSRNAKELDGFTAYKREASTTQSVKTADGEKTVVTDGKKIEWGRLCHTRLNLCFDDGEALYGLGQHEEGFMNLRGKTVYVYQANRKIAIPMLVSSKGWGMLFDTYSPLIFNDNEYGSYVYTEADREMDFYFINGGNPDGAVKGYRRLTGKAAMLPKWAFGYIQSQERYESFDEIISTVKEFRKRDIGVDCIVQDWCSWQDGMWGQKSFDPVHYPAPDKNISKIHELNAKFMLSIWPNPSKSTPDYDEFSEKGLMIETDDYYNAFSPEARDLYWKQVRENLWKYGVDAWWCDNSEPYAPEWNHIVRACEGRAYEEFVSAATDRFDPDKLCEYPFRHAQSLYEGQRGETDEKRVVNLTRCAYTGSQRFGTILWSGDTSASWDTYARQIAAGLNFCASGLPYWTMDIGGFFVKNSVNWYWDGDYDNTVADPAYRELYVRWFQWGAFLPIFRAHGTDCRREPWAFEDKSDMRFYNALVKANHLRYTLIPYIYSAAANAYFEDGSIIRPLAFEYPEDEKVQDIKNQYMFGADMMVCPVTRPMYFDADGEIAKPDLNVSVYLPEGGWYSLSTGEYFEGGGYISVCAPLDEIPVFVKAGSVIPFASYKPNAQAEDDITLTVFPGKDGETALYEDSGDGYGYENGEYKLTKIIWHDSERRLEVSDGRTFDYKVF